MKSIMPAAADAIPYTYTPTFVTANPREFLDCALRPAAFGGSVTLHTKWNEKRCNEEAALLVLSYSLWLSVIGLLDLLNDNCFDTRSLKHLACDFHVTSHEGHQFFSLRGIRNRC